MRQCQNAPMVVVYLRVCRRPFSQCLIGSFQAISVTVTSTTMGFGAVREAPRFRLPEGGEPRASRKTVVPTAVRKRFGVGVRAR